MVAVYLDIIIGIRISNREACRNFLDDGEDLTDEELEDIYFINEKHGWPNFLHDFDVRQDICCSDEAYVYIGYFKRRLYRTLPSDSDCCKKSDRHLCEDCFSTTEQGVISYKATREEGNSLEPTKFCRFCYSYNSYELEFGFCKVCNRHSPLEAKEIFDLPIPRLMGQEPKIWAVWNDCCSCT